MFTLQLRDKDSDEPSRMIIGGYDEATIDKMGTRKSGPEDADPSKTEDGIFWMNINSNSFW